MFKKNWPSRDSMKQLLALFTILSTSVATSINVHSVSQNAVQGSLPVEGIVRISPSDRVRREAGSTTHEETLSPEASEEYGQQRDKKVPRGFLGMRGKKAPSGFLGLRGRRSDDESYSEEEDSSFRAANDITNSLEEEITPRLGSPLMGSERVAHQLDLIKRAPSGFLGLRGKKAPSGFLGLRGKKAPSGFLGLRGKKAPSGFLGLRGKKAPSGFLGLRGKKDGEDYDQLETVLQELRQRYRNTQIFGEEKRTPRGFLGLRGKKMQPDFENDVTDFDFPMNDETGFRPYPDQAVYYDSEDPNIEKRGRSKFLGLRG